MFDYLSKIFAATVLYIQVSEKCLKVKNLKNGRTYEDKPVFALQSEGGKMKCLAFGSKAYQQKGTNIKLANGFSHPRTLLGDFVLIERALQEAVRESCQGGFFTPSPQIILHPQEKIEGGLTSVEIRALKEACAGSGARSVKIWIGRTLRDEEMLSGNYPLGLGENSGYNGTSQHYVL